MNHIYRIVWSRARGAWVVASELARGTGKGGGRRRPSLRGCLLLAPLSLFSSLALASPQGGQVVAGSGTIAQSGATTTINQTSQNLSLSWKSFNVGATETVDFNQPNSSALAVNRILDTNGSEILGHLNANGQVWLINPNGILFGAGAQVNVGGLVASTLDTSDGSTFSGDGTGSIVNDGTINAAKYVALLGKSVTNSGVITARLGTVAMGAGDNVSLTFSGNNLVKLQVNKSVVDSLVANHGLIQADGGTVVMDAGARDTLLASVVNNDGIVEARTVQDHDGTITLLGGMAGGTVNVGGTLDASAPNGGNGGFIETSAHNVHVADDATVTTLAANGLNGSWLIDPVDFTIAASGGNMTGATLSGELNKGSVTISSSSGNSGTNGDIYVNDAVSWSANTKLTLDAYRNIYINKAITGSGTSSQVELEYGQGAVNAGNTASYNFGLSSSGFAGQINLSQGSNFSTKLGSDGTVVDYIVITQLGSQLSSPAEMGGDGVDLQGMSGDPTANYVLGANIDASGTSSWNSNKGFTPVGSSSSNFTGSFDGLGHTISHLTINDSSGTDIGLFGEVTGTVRNVGMVGASVSVSGGSNVGVLVGYSHGGTISDSYASGSVSGAKYVGGLVGHLNNTGKVSDSYATGSVTSTGMGIYSMAGGLVGIIASGTTVSDSYATGSVSGSGQDVGGLAGYQDGTVSNSYATGSVTGSNNVGGLVGILYNGTVSGSYATGSVSGSGYVGGLVGNFQSGSVSDSYATGSVTGSDTVGGLVGVIRNTNATVSDSYATGSVSGSSYVGGLVGDLYSGTVSDSYATGSVSGSDTVGGLLGYEDGGSLSDSYATGSVSGSAYVGGAIGHYVAGANSDNYWDTTTAHQPVGVGGGTSNGVSGMATADMMTQANFTSATTANGGVNPNWDFTNTWVMYAGHTYPLLRALMTPLTISADGSKAYDGTPVSGSEGVTYSLSSVDSSHLFGTLVYSNPNMVNAGSYSGVTVSGLYSDQQGYLITFKSGTVTITAGSTAPQSVVNARSNEQSLTFGGAPQPSWSAASPPPFHGVIYYHGPQFSFPAIPGLVIEGAGLNLPPGAIPASDELRHNKTTKDW